MKHNPNFMAEISQEINIHKKCCFILEIPIGYTFQDLKKAYREKAKKWHPDHNNNTEESKKKFIILKCAYDFLAKNIFPDIDLLNSIYFKKEDDYNHWKLFLWWREQFFNISEEGKQKIRKSCI